MARNKKGNIDKAVKAGVDNNYLRCFKGFAILGDKNPTQWVNWLG